MTDKTIEDVSLEVAEIFYRQCGGTTTSSYILAQIAHVHGIETKEQFAEFIRACADWLDGGGRA